MTADRSPSVCSANRLPEGSTEDSHALHRIAAELARLCPPELGQEIVTIGSVGWGTADAESDIDLELWVDEVPAQEMAQAWLEEAGAVDLAPDSDSNAGQTRIICRFQGVWVEASWREISAEENVVLGILTGENTGRAHLVQAWNLSHAVALRTSGALARWQRLLSDYPDVVRERVIASASAFWAFPHRVEMLWTLAHREELLGLTTWLMADVSDALRILFAVNRQWEMDWKHLRLANQALTIKPAHLVERVDDIFSAVPYERRVATSMRLILDVLDLVPSSCDVSSAITNIRQSLHAHADCRAGG